MNKLTKRILSVFLAVAMIVTILPPVTAQAATTKEKMTLYAGEAYEFYTIGFDSMSSASSTKKNVATVKLDKKNKRYTIKAKKAGKTVITVNGKDWYKKAAKLQITITVKKPSFTIKTQGLDGGYALISIKNNTKATFDSLSVNYTFKNSEGRVVEQKTEKVSYVIAGKTAYETVYVGRDADIDYEQSVVKVTGYDRNPSYTYKTANSEQLTVKVVDQAEDESKISYKLKEKSTLNQYLHGHVYVISYDSEDNIIAVDDWRLYL